MTGHVRKHRIIFFIIFIGLALVLSGCGAQEAPVVEEPETAEEEAVEDLTDLPVFTLAELAEYDGRDGRSAYVAVDGLVYDFTELGRWSGGTHNGYEAGQDLTEALHEVSPHGASVLDRAPVVGRLE